jgi:hypothetical protein
LQDKATDNETKSKRLGDEDIFRDSKKPRTRSEDDKSKNKLNKFIKASCVDN